MKIVPFLGAILFLATAAGAAEEREKQAASSTSSSVDFEIAEPASWVKPVTVSGELEAGMENTGTVYLLVDRQDNLDRNAFYYHEVRKITSENGLQSGASFSVAFYPAFEKLTLHSLQVVRDGVASNRLERSSIRLSAQEKDPLRLSYDSSFRADVALDDVRVGDVIEYAYTREGGNPLRRGKSSATYSMQWDFPIARNFLRLIYAADRKINFQARNGALQPTVTTANGVTELLYDARNVPGRVQDEDTPNGYSPRQRLETSEFQDWAAVVQWAKPLFDNVETHSPEFQAEIERLKAINDPEQRVVAALQFVQTEIRDVSITSWVGDRALTAPDELMRRRAADDKEKALLLIALLRGSGIDATPALVSDVYREDIRPRLPSPQLFDHVIVQVRLGNAIHWVDPWRSSQRGPLSQIYVARYGYALVLRPETTDLTPFTAPRTSWPVKKIVETYRVPAPGYAGELDVVSDYHGLAADQVRAAFRENTRAEMQQRYLRYYAGMFPEAKPRRLVWYEELPGVNACRVTESYEIPQIWRLSEEKDSYLLDIKPGDISSAIGSAITPPRVDPLRLSYPNSVSEEMNIEMFEPWQLEIQDKTSTTPFFTLRDKASLDGSHVQFNYDFEGLKDRVEPGEIGNYNKAVEEAKNSLGYTLKYRTAEQLEKAKPRTTFNWAVGAAGLCFLGSASYFAVRYFRASRLATPRPPPLDTSAELVGLGGWLILLALGQLVRPITYLKSGRDLFNATMDTHSWRLMTDPIEATYNPWWAPTLLVELFLTIGFLVFCFLLIALFFGKRAAWPRCFAVFLVMSVLGVTLDIVLSHQIPAAAEPIAASIRSIATVAIAAAIWIPYVTLSKRVKATFRY